MHPPNPPAQIGTLGEHSLAALLAYALATRHDGALRLTERVGKGHAIGLSRGGIVELRTALPLPSIGHVLVDLGALAEEVYWRTSRAFGSDDLAFAEELSASGVVRAASLVQARAEQIARGVVRLSDALYESTTFSLVHEAPPKATLPPIDPLPLVFECVLAKGLDGQTSARLDALGDRPIALADGASLERLRAGGDDARALAALEASPTKLRDLARLGCVPVARWRRIAGALLLADFVAY
jgi:hypothetical protein